MGDYFVRLRETGRKRHEYLGSNALTSKWMHAVSFETDAAARDAATWMLRNNADTLDSAQVLHGFGGKVVEAFTLADLARASAEQAPQLRLACDPQGELAV